MENLRSDILVTSACPPDACVLAAGIDAAFCHAVRGGDRITVESLHVLTGDGRVATWPGGRGDGLDCLRAWFGQWLRGPERWRTGTTLTVRAPCAPGSVLRLTLERSAPDRVTAVLARRTPDAVPPAPNPGAVPVPDPDTAAASAPVPTDAGARAGLGADPCRDLAPRARALVQALAVLGGDVALPRLGTLVGGVDSLLTPLQSAVDTGLVSWRADRGCARVTDGVRAAVTAGMTPSETRAAHAWAAEWSQGPTSLLHRAAAAEAPDDGLAGRLESEAERLGAAGHSARAVELFQRAAALSSQVEDSVRRHVRAAEFATRAHLTGPARRSLDAVRQHPPSPVDLMLSGRISVLEGDLRTGLAQLGEAYGALRRDAADGRRPERDTAATWLAHATWLAGGPSREVRRLLGGSAVPSADPYWSAARRQLEGLLLARVEGPRAALGQLRRSDAVVRSAPPSVRRQAEVLSAWLSLESGLLGPAEEAVRSALELDHLAEGDFAGVTALVLRSHLLWLRGDWEGAERGARAVAVCGLPLWEPVGAWLLRLVHVARGTPPTADVPPPLSDSVLESWPYLFCRVVAGVESGDRRAVRELLAAPECARGLELLHSALLPWRKLEIVRAALLAGEPELAGRFRAALRDNARSGTVWVRSFASWADACVAAHEGRRGDAERHYAEAEQGMAGLRRSAPWYHARFLADHAEFAAAAGRRRDALDRFHAARETARELGAAPLVKRCSDGLNRLRLPRPRGGFGLTERERDVAQLVSTGLTNKEAAARLFVTPASIAFHLSNIYVKIGVRTRYELRQWWTQEAGAGGTGGTGGTAGPDGPNRPNGPHGPYGFGPVPG
ncbi:MULTISPECIES: LuxR C-terminal-related transcriptional regulator [unclassified Streptomyces]|uniref:LuxR C-terminal-related transcriptional regulator n=1 Tax=unclassified Streptomyces TaxID=2593676 RepID=UPI003823F569